MIDTSKIPLEVRSQITGATPKQLQELDRAAVMMRRAIAAEIAEHGEETGDSDIYDLPWE